MHIAIVLMKYNPYGGYERQAAILAEALAERGDSVTVFANKWIGASDRNIGFQKVPMIKGMAWLKALSFAVFSRFYLVRRSEEIDVVIAFDRTLIMDIYRAGNACHKEWLNFRKKHGNISDFVSIAINPLHTIINNIEKRIFNRIQKIGGNVIVLSHIGAQQIKRNYSIDENRFVVIPPAVDISRFNKTNFHLYRKEKRLAMGIEKDTLILLHVGSGFRIKGLDSTIASLSILNNKGIKSELVVVGKDKRGTQKYLKLCYKLGISKQVHFLGAMNSIESIYAASDIFVLPSLLETFCIAAIEALACGLPVIIGKGAGVSYMIEKEKMGKVIDVPANPDKLAELIEETAIIEKELKSSGKTNQELERRLMVALKYDRDAIKNSFLSVIDQQKKNNCINV